MHAFRLQNKQTFPNLEVSSLMNTGKRILWQLQNTVFVIVSFVCLFNPILFEIIQLGYFSPNTKIFKQPTHYLMKFSAWTTIETCFISLMSNIKRTKISHNKNLTTRRRIVSFSGTLSVIKFSRMLRVTKVILEMHFSLCISTCYENSIIISHRKLFLCRI